MAPRHMVNPPLLHVNEVICITTQLTVFFSFHSPSLFIPFIKNIPVKQSLLDFLYYFSIHFYSLRKQNWVCI